MPNRKPFWAHVQVTETCWLWTGCTDPSGYGRYGRAYVHRFVYERLIGPIPAAMQIDHLCSVRNCVRPDHLEAVTGAMNVQRAAAARRVRLRQPAMLAENLQHKRPRTTTMAVRDVGYLRDTLTHSGLTYRAAAERAGVSHATIANMARGGRPGCTRESAEKIAAALGVHNVALLFTEAFPESTS